MFKLLDQCLIIYHWCNEHHNVHHSFDAKQISHGWGFVFTHILNEGFPLKNLIQNQLQYLLNIVNID